MIVVVSERLGDRRRLEINESRMCFAHGETATYIDHVRDSVSDTIRNEQSTREALRSNDDAIFDCCGSF